jgi:hypothetical protein
MKDTEQVCRKVAKCFIESAEEFADYLEGLQSADDDTLNLSQTFVPVGEEIINSCGHLISKAIRKRMFDMMEKFEAWTSDM